MTSLVGQNIGRYHIVEQLGQGGMAVVYKAFDTRLERDVAIKVIRTEMILPAQLQQMLKRFEREARALAKMEHRSIVNIFDYGEYQGAPYVVMEYLPGGTLKELAGQQMTSAAAARLLLPIAQALDYAHQRDIIHRDVKPANILITRNGEPLLSDFGIAKMLKTEQATQLTTTGAGIGTPQYMAPEQWEGQALPQTDIYALGVVLYELVTGRRPYEADTPAAIFRKALMDPLPRPREFAPDLPDQAEKVIFKALAKNPADRYPTMGDFAHALEVLISTTPPPAQEGIDTIIRPPEDKRTPDPAVEALIEVAGDLESDSNYAAALANYRKALNKCDPGSQHAQTIRTAIQRLEASLAVASQVPVEPLSPGSEQVIRPPVSRSVHVKPSPVPTPLPEASKPVWWQRWQVWLGAAVLGGGRAARHYCGCEFCPAQDNLARTRIEPDTTGCSFSSDQHIYPRC